MTRRSIKFNVYFLSLVFSAIQLLAAGDGNAEKPLRIGFIGSLTGISASYGHAVLQGATLAVDELKQAGVNVELIVEDDHSVSKDTVLALAKLRNVDKVQALIGGSWWINSIAKQSESYHLPLLSCETLYNKDYVKAATYFSLGGDLRDWVRVFEPLIESKGFKTAATVKFTSGFADTIAEEMQRLFSKPGRSYLGNIEYADFGMEDAGSLVVKLRQLNPDVVYLDAQPASFANFVRKMNEAGLKNISILTNSIADDAINQRLMEPASLNERLYFTKRESFNAEFLDLFSKHTGRRPTLSAGLGYYALLLLKGALTGHDDPAVIIKSGQLSVKGINFSFDENNVWHGVSQNIWMIRAGKVAELNR